MKNILVFAGSNSKTSINKQLATYAAQQLENVELNIVDLNDYELPIYGIDLENAQGIPANATKFVELIGNSDGIVVSAAEHNGSYTAVFKNLIDWMSRANKNFWQEKPMLLMATSPGKRGGMSVLETVKKSFPFFGAKVVADYSLPLFNANFAEGKITNKELDESLKEAVAKLQQAL